MTLSKNSSDLNKIDSDLSKLQAGQASVANNLSIFGELAKCKTRNIISLTQNMKLYQTSNNVVQTTNEMNWYNM